MVEKIKDWVSWSKLAWAMLFGAITATWWLGTQYQMRVDEIRSAYREREELRRDVERLERWVNTHENMPAHRESNVRVTHLLHLIERHEERIKKLEGRP